MNITIDKRLLEKSFIYTFIIGFIAHGYFFSNFLVSHDSLNNLFISGDWSKANFGRIFYHVYMILSRGRIVLPWLIGILAIFWCSLAVYLIIQLFKMKQPMEIAIVSAICITNPTVYALTATYIHDLDADLFALFLSVLSVTIWNKALTEVNKKKKYSFLACGALFLSIVLGIYQSYISVAIALIIMYLIKELIERKAYVEVFVQGIQGVVMLMISAILYLVEIKIFSAITGISIMNNNSYNGLGNMTNVFSDNLSSRIVNVYIDFFMAFKKLVSSYPGRTYLMIHLLLAIVCVAIVLYAMKKRCWQSWGLIVLLGITLPFGMNVSLFLSGETIHDIMRYAFWLVYVLVLILAIWLYKNSDFGRKYGKFVYGVVIGCLLIVVSGNIQTSNTIYVKKDLEYQSTLSYMTRVADRMEQQEDYVPGETPVMIVGDDSIGMTRYGFEAYTSITGAELESPITFYDTYEKYFDYVLGRTVCFYDDDTLKNDERVLEMPSFPKAGSVRMVDGVLVVKLK